MSAKINLLPDVRQAKIDDKSRRQLAITLAVGSVVVTAGLVVIGFLIIQGQHLRINQLTNSIKERKHKIATYPNVKAILGTQARVAALPNLYNQRVYMTKLADILTSVEPQDTDFTSVNIASGQLTIAAEGRSYLAAAKLAKAVEGANVTTGAGASASNTPYFTNVQLSAVALSTNKTSYTITAILNPGATSGH